MISRILAWDNKYAKSNHETPPLYNRERGLGRSKTFISNPNLRLDKGEADCAVFSPPVVLGNRLIAPEDNKEWRMFCREAGFSKELEKEHESEVLGCNDGEVEVAYWNFAHGRPSQRYKTKTMSEKFLVCRDNNMKVMKQVVCCL